MSILQPMLNESAQSVFYRPHRNDVDYLLGVQRMYEVRKPLAKAMRLKTSELPEHILRAFEEIERGEGRYSWVFQNEADAEQFVRFSGSQNFKRYSKPQNLEEAGTDLLAQLLPAHCKETLELSGTLICRHPFIGPRAGAGSVQTEAPWTIPRARWLDAYGFGVGCLVLIEVTI